MKELKNICYRDDMSKVDPGIDIINKIKEFVTAKLKDQNKSASEEVDGIIFKSDVLKATGIIIMTPPLASQIYP